MVRVLLWPYQEKSRAGEQAHLAGKSSLPVPPFASQLRVRLVPFQRRWDISTPREQRRRDGEMCVVRGSSFRASRAVRALVNAQARCLVESRLRERSNAGQRVVMLDGAGSEWTSSSWAQALLVVLTAPGRCHRRLKMEHINVRRAWLWREEEFHLGPPLHSAACCVHPTHLSSPLSSLPLNLLPHVGGMYRTLTSECAVTWPPRAVVLLAGWTRVDGTYQRPRSKGLREGGCKWWWLEMSPPFRLRVAAIVRPSILQTSTRRIEIPRASAVGVDGMHGCGRQRVSGLRIQSAYHSTSSSLSVVRALTPAWCWYESEGMKARGREEGRLAGAVVIYSVFESVDDVAGGWPGHIETHFDEEERLWRRRRRRTRCGFGRSEQSRSGMV
ncbi:hypothetical protein SCHPADRAFT_894234 [Schizopora paradoxa]|uniref:Uncharacterized protein n=1 Tax=Schizopora paradoxa TaxID=27342 RepID=A0A0H2R999_9AGAM|nr:hypothetical protein SCHPADRAFT_894234 [Schizopora paradoxa]